MPALIQSMSAEIRLPALLRRYGDVPRASASLECMFQAKMRKSDVMPTFQHLQRSQNIHTFRAEDPKMFASGTLFICRGGTRSFPSAEGNEACRRGRPKARRLSRPVIRSGLRVLGALPVPRDGKDLSGARQMKRVTEANIADRTLLAYAKADMFIRALRALRRAPPG